MKKNNQPILPIVVLIAALTWTSLARAQQTGTDAETTPAQQALINEMKAMTWLKDTTITLPDSHARLVLPNGHSAVSGRDAKRLDQLINGTSRESDDEAQVVSSDLRYQVNFAFFKGGYVDEGDWYTLDPSKIRNYSPRLLRQNRIASDTADCGSQGARTGRSGRPAETRPGKPRHIFCRRRHTSA